MLVLATVGINAQFCILQYIGFFTTIWRVSDFSPAGKPAILNMIVYVSDRGRLVSRFGIMTVTLFLATRMFIMNLIWSGPFGQACADHTMHI